MSKPTARYRAAWLEEHEWRPFAKDLNLPIERLPLRELRGGQAVLVEETWVELPLTSEWTSAARLALQDGQLVVAEVRIFPNEPDRGRGGLWSAELLGAHALVPRGGLSMATYRRVRLTEYRKAIMAILAQLRETGYKTSLGLAVERPRRERPGAKPDMLYARLSEEYVGLINRGIRHPIAELAARRRVKSSQMRDMIREARERGLLTPSKQGRSGGALTGRAVQLLKRGSASHSTRGKRK